MTGHNSCVGLLGGGWGREKQLRTQLVFTPNCLKWADHDMSCRRDAAAAATSTAFRCRRRRSSAAAVDIWIWARPCPRAGPAAVPLRRPEPAGRRLSDCCCCCAAAAAVAVAGVTSDSCPANSPTRCPVWASPSPGRPRAPSAGCPSGYRGSPRAGCRRRTASPAAAVAPSFAMSPLGTGAVSRWTSTFGAVPANGLSTRPTPTAWTCRSSLKINSTRPWCHYC